MFSRRFHEVLVSDLRSLKFMQGVVAMLLAFGFLFLHSDTTNYDYLINVFSPEIWGDIFLLYGLFRVSSALYELHHWLKFVGGFIGILLWTFLLLSFTVYDTTPLKSTEWMLAIPLVGEIWMLAECMFLRKNSKRKGD